MISFHFKKGLKYLLGFVGGVFLLTLILSAGITLALVIANNNGSLQKWVNLALAPVQVSYQSATVSWHRGSPRLDLDQVEINDGAHMQAPLAIDHFSIDLSVWRSIYRREPVANGIHFSGIKLRLIQEPDGYFKLQDYAEPANSPSMTLSPAVARWFLNQGAVRFENVTLQTTLRNQKVLNIHLDHVDWVNLFDYRFDLEGEVAEIPGSNFSMVAHLTPGHHRLDLQQWKLDFAGKLQANTFVPILGDEIFKGLNWDSGGGSIEFKGVVFNEALQSVNFDVALSNLNLRNSNTNKLIAPQFNEHIVWNRATDGKGGWQIDIVPLYQTDFLGPAYDSALRVNYIPNASDYIWKLSAQKVDLAILGEWINFWFKPTSKTAEIWDMVNPRGQIDTFGFQSGPAGGQANFSSSQLQMDGNKMFPNPWPASQVSVAASWSKLSVPVPAWNIKIQNAEMKNKWISVKAAGGIVVPLKNPENPILNLKGQFSAQNLEQVKKFYIPEGDVSPALSAWLQNGLIKLPVVTGDLVFKGPVKGFPYANNNGLFNLAIHVKNGEINPHAAWPNLTNINADLLFHNQVLTIDAKNIKTLNIPISSVYFEIADLRPKTHDPIEITGTSHLTGDQALAYIAAMPLTPAGVDKFLLSSHLSGPLDLALKVTIPLIAKAQIIAAGTVNFNQNDWYLNKNSKSPLLGDVQGQLQFVNQMISGINLSAYAMSQTLHFSILTSPVTDLKFLINSFRVFGQLFHQVQLGWVPVDNHILFNLNGPELTGTVNFEGLNKPVSAHFAQVRLSSISTDSMPMLSTAAAQPKATLPKVPLLGNAIAGLPVITFSIDHLFYNGQDLGMIHWGSSPVKNGILIQQFILTSTPIQINAGGMLQTVDNQDHISVNGHFNTKDYGLVLKELGYPGVLSGGSGPIDLDLSWVGGLHIDYTTLNGKMKFNIANGEFLQINAGFAKIFGLFSLDSIINTLSFNFHKMFGSGLSFDTMSGSYTVKNGIATTSDFRLSGPALTMSMKGQIDLVNDTIDEKVTIMPQLGTGIAVAAGIVATPIAGVAAWFADKLLTSTILKDAGVVINVTGPLSNPKVGK